jgi:hypothetical protein
VETGGVSGSGLGVICRQASATRTFIRAIFSIAADNIEVQTWSAGISTLVGNRTPTLAINDVVRMEVEGTSPNIIIRVYVNGT